MIHKQGFNIIFTLCAVFSTTVTAANLNFTGTLVIPPLCTVSNMSNGTEIGVTFSDRMDINKINGTNYLQKIPYKVSCGTGSSGLDLKLILSGSPAPFDDGSLAILNTDKSGLGIKIYQNANGSSVFPLNTKVKVNIGALPELWAAPIKKTDATLAEGRFDASATLTAEYE